MVGGALVLALVGSGRSQSGWAVSPVLLLPPPAYSVLGVAPGCDGGILVDSAIRRLVEGGGRRTPDPVTEPPSWLSRAIAETLNLFGTNSVLQDHANCTEVCALVPLEATRITNLVGYVALGPKAGFTAVPFDRLEVFFGWDPDVDTTRWTEDGRRVCARARNWYGAEDTKVFLVVGYE